MKKEIKHVKPPTYDLQLLQNTDDIYAILDEFADDFLTLAKASIGSAFLPIRDYSAFAEKQTDHPERELRRTPPDRYFLEILSYVLLSRQFKVDFMKRKSTVIILPDCLSIRLEHCEAKKTKYGRRCTACDTECKINAISKIAAEYGAGAFFADSKLESQLKSLAKGKYKDLSVVGIACIMMLANGMRDAEEAGVPSQGVLLNYCGCEHWTDEQFPTDATVSRLRALLEEKRVVQQTLK